MIKLKKLLSEALNPRRYSEIKGQAKYLAMEMKTLNKGIKSKNEKDVVDSIDYILGKAKMMKEILTDNIHWGLSRYFTKTRRYARTTTTELVVR